MLEGAHLEVHNQEFELEHKYFDIQTYTYRNILIYRHKRINIHRHPDMNIYIQTQTYRRTYMKLDMQT